MPRSSPGGGGTGGLLPFVLRNRDIVILTVTYCNLVWGTWGLFLESPGNFSGPLICFMCAVFTLKVKVSVILKMIQ